MSLIYGLLAWIDSVVYWVAAALFRVIMDIANTQFFGDTQIDTIANRIYVVLGVLILFKVVISAVQYLVNPDSFDDKEKGFAGILKKTILTVAMVIISPAIFEFAVTIQKPILGAIPSIILGSENAVNFNEDKIGQQLSFTVLSSFVKARDGKGGSVGPNKEIHDIESFASKVNEGVGFFDIKNAKYDYMIIISTLSGGFLCYVLLSMALDIAIRTIKFGLIRIMAPIPISSYIFGKDKLNKFIKTALHVYADLFIRMIIVYVIILVIQMLVDPNLISDSPLKLKEASGGATFGDWIRTQLVNIAIIFGLLMFAKNAPKFITDLLGLPDIGSGDFKDMFKPAWQRVGGLPGLSAAAGSFRSARDYGEGVGRSLLRGAVGGAHGVAARLKDVASGKSLEESYKSAKEAALARTNKNLEYKNRYPDFWKRHGQMWQERIDKFTGTTSGGKKAAANIEAANKAIATRSDLWSRAEEKVLETSGGGYSSTITASYTDASGATRSKSYTLSQLLTRMNDLENGATPTWAGEKEWLMNNKQKSIDAAKIEFIQKSLGGNGDGKARNKFAEDIFAFMRSGGDSKEVNQILNQTIEGVYDPNTGNTVDVKIDLAWAANTIANGGSINELTAAALAKYIQGYTGSDGKRHGIESDAGSMRVRAVQTQTSTPNEGK